MSTQHDIGKDQDITPRVAESLHTQDTLREEKVSPSQSFPHPPKRPFRPKRNRWVMIGGVLLALALILSLGIIFIPGVIQRSGGKVISVPTTPAPATTVPAIPGSDVTPTPAPGVTPGPQVGPDTLKDPAYWTPFLPASPNASVAQQVTFGNLLGKPGSLQAMVVAQEIVGGGPTFRDVFVFDRITSPTPRLLFKVVRMLHGSAKVSGYSTILTAEIDLNSAINRGKPDARMTVDLFREFQWSDRAGTFVQVAFPGIFPDLTRYQAEADQESINQGHQPWKNNPELVAKALAVQFFGWKRDLTTRVLSGGGARDVNATVQVQEVPVTGVRGQGPSVMVRLSRLEGNTHNMWIAIDVQDGAGALTSIAARSLITSPVQLEGKGSAFEGTIGMASILDHLYTPVGQALVTGVPGLGMGTSPYSIAVSFNTSFKQGLQEGVVEVALTSPIQSEPYGAVLVKVLLDPQPGVVQGPVSGPIEVQKPGYWASVLGLPSTKFSMGTASYANMKGDPSLQALVSVYHTDGSQSIDISVYDNITSAHPLQLFKLQGLVRGGAMISGYSTILTSQVDPNSSVNKGKSGDQLTADLYREFKWSDDAGAFVQTTFPGIFPDLTRYQAEMDQNQVTIGKDSWKTNATQVAQKMATQLLKWSPTASTSIVSGGGPTDVDAVVQVKSPNPGGMAIKVALSRLEGNTSNMWVVIGVDSSNGLLTITSPVKGERLNSPITLKGAGSAFEGVIGRAYVLDHLYGAIGQAQVTGAGMGKTPYTTTVNYTSSFQGGTQEGVVAVYMYSQADGSIATATMKKVMLSV